MCQALPNDIFKSSLKIGHVNLWRMRKNTKATKRLLSCAYFRNRPIPSNKKFSKLTRNMRKSENFEKRRNVFKPRTARNEKHIVAVLVRDFVDLHVSIR